jgi:tetratricopeptide (TPR) repeat protein
MFQNVPGIIAVSLLLLLSCNSPAKEDLSTESELNRLNKMIESEPGNAKNYYNRGEYFYNNESYKNAISDLKKASKLDSLNRQNYLLLSDAYLYDYKSKEAVKTLEKFIGLKPGDTETLLKLTQLQYTLKQYDIALLTVNEVFKTDLQNANALFLLGAILKAKGNNEAAANALRSSVEIDPEIIDAWVLLADLQAEDGDPEAHLYYDNALAIDSTNIAALHSKAYYLQNHDQIPAALAIYKKIHAIDSSYAEAYLNAGILQLELKQNEKALAEFNQLALLYPNLILAYYYRALCYELLEQKEEALSDYRKCLELDPEFKQAEEAISAMGAG